VPQFENPKVAFEQAEAQQMLTKSEPYKNGAQKIKLRHYRKDV